MDSHALAVIRPAALALLLVSAAACGSAPRTSPVPGATTPAGTSPIAASTDEPAATPRATRTAEPAGEPPVATLSGLGIAGPPGALGTFSWDGLVSDSPWIVGMPGIAAAPGLQLTVEFAHPAAPPSGWRARWATIVDGGPGAQADGGSGPGPIVGLATPGSPGSWSLQLTVEFGPGRTATWYWRIEVAP